MTRRLFFLVLALSLTIGLVASPTAAVTESDLDRVQENIAEIRGRISYVAAERSRTAKRLIALEEDIAEKQSAIDAATSEMGAIRVAIELGSEDLAGVQAELATQLENLAATRKSRSEAQDQAQRNVLDAYMGGGPVRPAVAFDAADVTRVSVGVAYLGFLAESNVAAANRYAALLSEEEAIEAVIREREAAVVAELTGLEELNAQFSASEMRAREQQAELEATSREVEETLAALEREIDEFEGELAALAREETSIRSAIEAAAAASNPTTSSGGFVRPVPGAVSSGFGMRVHPITGQNRMHNGLDMNGATGDPIRAAKSGTVILAGVKGGYGNTVMIDHGGGMVTLYAHQSRFAVSQGQQVAAGAVIGYVGSTGVSTGPHLHFEVRINGQPTDPAKYL
ncbi:MAG: peptidoglycan DD-metalloendopeptidase family protein [Acidimicrobiia bacterium]|nr:peptidoglycan DD-metalloendopeptidase family protein [Acidimicrobiia bacterium]